MTTFRTTWAKIEANAGYGTMAGAGIALHEFGGDWLAKRGLESLAGSLVSAIDAGVNLYLLSEKCSESSAGSAAGPSKDKWLRRNVPPSCRSDLP